METETPAPSSLRPDNVVVVARTHWAMGAAVLVSIGLITLVTMRFPFEFGPRTYVITGSLAAVYTLAGTLVWFGAPLGRPLSRICGLIYLTRPRLGLRIWKLMDSAEFQAHFTPKKPISSEATKP